MQHRLIKLIVKKDKNIQNRRKGRRKKGSGRKKRKDPEITILHVS